MIRTLEIRNLGPHERVTFDLDPTGATVISGPSKAGKSFALRAVCFALWGCDTDGRPLSPGAVRDGQDRAEVTLTMASGTVVRRTMTRRGAKTRSLHKAGTPAPVSYASDGEFNAALPAALTSAAARIVAVPEAWRELAAGNARPLRDLLASLLPPADVSAVVARLIAPAVLRPGDPLDEAGATEARRAANAARDRAAGALDAAREAAQATDGPTAEEVAAADAAAEDAARTIAWGGAWRLYEDACAARDQAAERTARELAEWQRRADAVPAEVPGEELDAARRAAEAARVEHADLSRAAERWRDHDAACTRAMDAADRAAQALADWERRAADLPAEVTDAEIDAALDRANAYGAALHNADLAADAWARYDTDAEACAEDRARAEVARLRQAAAKTAFDAAAASLAALNDLLALHTAESLGTCEACGQTLPMPAVHLDRIARARRTEQDARDAYRDAAHAASRCERDLALGASEPPPQPAMERPDAADVARVREASTIAVAAHAALERQRRERELAVRTLGPRPVADPVAATPPVQPDVPRPSDDEVSRAASKADRLARLCADLDSRAMARRSALATLGPRPSEAAGDPIPAPSMPCPSADDYAAAHAAVTRARDMASAHVAAARQHERAAHAYAAAQMTHAVAVAEAARLDALVDAVRRAPSEIARDQVEAVGDLGPVTLAWGDGTAQSPAVSVLVDGRPWGLASTGAQVVADVYLRAAIRRLAKLVPLPIWIDRVQDVAGIALPRPGACVLLVTEAGALSCGPEGGDR